MKKLFLAVGIVVVLLLAAVIIIPWLFKGKIIQLVKEQASEHVTATLDFDDIGLSLIKQFPRLTFSIENLRLLNQAPFEGDTLTAMREFQATVNLSSLFGNQPLKINAVYLDSPRLNLKALKDGRANWQIIRQSPETQKPQPEGQSNLNLAVQRYEIRNAHIRYIDEATDQQLELQGLYHEGRGDFRKRRFILETQSRVDNLALRMRGISYLNHAALQANVDLDMDLEQQKYLLKENEIRLNQLMLKADGWIARDGEHWETDLRFEAPEADFKDILSMIPFIYRRDFADLQAAGKLSVNGTVQGRYSERQIPAFNIALTIRDGLFQYPDLPTPVKQVQADLKIQNPGKNADDTIIDLKRLHLEILSDALDARALIKTPLSDPYLNAALKGMMNLGEIKKVFPLPEGVDVSGNLRSDVQFAGNLSAFQQNRLENISAGGRLAFSEVLYMAPELPGKVHIKKGELQFSSQKTRLNDFSALLGKSDLQAQGFLENLFGYLFRDQTIKGTLALQSNFLDLNPWMAGESEGLSPVELPARVEFLLTANFKRVLFDNLNLNNLSGNMLLKDQVLNLMDLQGNLFSGSLNASGTYSYIAPRAPKIYFDIKISEFGISQTFKSFVTVRQFTPFVENMRGTFNASLNLNSELDDQLIPIWQQFFSQGSLSIPKVNFQNATIFNRLAEITKISQLYNPALNHLNPNYRIKGGRFYLQPLTFQIDKYQIVASGSNGIDKSLDYTMKIHIPAEEAKKTANTFINQLINKDVNLLTNETIVMDVAIKGTFEEPRIQTSLSDIVKGAADPLVDAAKLEAEKQAQSLIDKQKEELEKQKKEAEQKLKEKLKDLFKKKP